MLGEALGDLAGLVDIAFGTGDPSTASPIETPLWDALGRASSRLVPDARHLRDLGTTCYGFGLFSEALSFADYSARVHGDDERIDLGSLQLCVELWPAVIEDLLGSK